MVATTYEPEQGRKWRGKRTKKKKEEGHTVTTFFKLRSYQMGKIRLCFYFIEDSFVISFTTNAQANGHIFET